ncbi:hydrolase CocE/NonD family protein [Stanieria cyanosphaera PCC 7437]|uniref:Hydrolase CocE/NonD family protein n=1 Tax=Stanieria cyanosphaera (strain ATCC 29371 / PCC 7437) TaxID=111780 RepID=K9XZD8_STAC7|nr:CocE/NonD family hydrolase [Stanieria cyanosphaera]AFZ37404.1 hydrolase CocE/NonD family protein [Stanieria cyanosphaera PCC 7437]
MKIKQETVSMYTRDGVRLDADIYRPDTKEDLPILLMRQPYGRKIASTVVYAHPSWYAAQGYLVVIQDVRGRGTSEGEFDLLTHEIADGLDTINWVSQLPGSTGEIGMYGFSYQGMTQLYAAVERPQALKVICPAMVAYDLYHDWAYENGAFCLQANLGWAIQLAAETARLKGDETAYYRLYQASHSLPLSDRIPASPDILNELAPDSFYHLWLKYYDPNHQYWQKRSLKNLIQDVDLPMLHIGGWFDPYLRGTLNLYQAMTDRSRFPQHLIVGPWAHLPWGRKLGSIDYGSEAQNPIDEAQIRWFDYFLKRKDTGILDESPICLFEMGSNQWCEWKEFPSQKQKIYYFVSDGLASMREDSGMLWEYEEEIASDSLSTQELLATDLLETTEDHFPSSTDILVHDPWRPVPALGGHATFPGGSFERSSLDCRSDILTYTSAPLEQELHLVGTVIIEVYCTADTPSFDLCAVLSQVTPDSKVFNLTQGYIRVDTPQTPITIPLQPTCILIPLGNSLRVSLSAACFPAYPVNPGTGSLSDQTRLIEAQIITLKISSSLDFPSQLKLSVL